MQFIIASFPVPIFINTDTVTRQYIVPAIFLNLVVAVAAATRRSRGMIIG